MKTNKKIKKIIRSLKENEISKQRIKVIQLTKSLIENPDDKNYAICLKQTLQRLETLLIA